LGEEKKMRKILPKAKLNNYTEPTAERGKFGRTKLVHKMLEKKAPKNCPSVRKARREGGLNWKKGRVKKGDQTTRVKN